VFRLRGYSSSGKLGWKLFKVDRMENVEVLDEHFKEVRPEYNPDDRHIVHVVCRIFD